MPKISQIYLYTVFALGLAVILLIMPSIDAALLCAALTLALFAGLLDKYCVELPNGTLFSGSSIFTFATLLCFGLPEALVVEIVIALFGAIFERIQLIKVLFNVGQYALSIAAAGSVYEWLGGAAGSFSWQDIPALMTSLFVYNLVNLCLVSVAIAKLTNQGVLMIWLDSLKDTGFIYVVTLVLSLRLGLIFHPDRQIQFWMEAAFIFLFFLALRYAFRMFIELRKTYLHSLESFTNMTEDKLSISVGHAARVGRLARQLAEELKLPLAEIDAIHYAALFHDVGKGQVRESIFKKRGPLTLEEEKEQRKHVEIGAEMVRDISGLEKASDYVLYHHEQWGGGGYPKGLQGEEIPLGARVIAAADHYDKLLHDKKEGNPAKRFAKLADNVLDPRLVKLVMKIADFTIEPEVEKTSVEPNRVTEVVVTHTNRHKVDQSVLMQKFEASLFAVYEDGFRDGMGESIAMPLTRQIAPLAERAREEQKQIREYVEDPDTGKVYDLYCYPYQHAVFLSLFDVTGIIEYELKQEERIKILYRDVIFSVTQGKLLLADEEQIRPYSQGDCLAEASIDTKKDVALCREQVSKTLESLGIVDKTKFSILLCTSEVVTNVLKHAEHGRMRVCTDGAHLRVIVADNGNGIELSELPKSTLLAGYSSKVSMGQGFSLMLKLMDRVIINTGHQGTTVVLEVKLEGGGDDNA
ncbi:HD domain-containing phosphohydrolase [Brevibacillus migulae]|uniref:HD domain-containing phosphohydrolase n=1 Tax=Brevibacillus migulae TaxID=1644114 RepID=UPI00142F9C3E|nr:HD domain-containing phosphohydrolase [Brevibacillus migulae]